MSKHHASAALAVVVVVVVSLLAPEVECAKFILGGDAGWTNSADIDYSAWLSDYKIKVGDSLTFHNADTTDHSVIEVDKLGYDTCGASGNQLDDPFTISQGIAYTLTFPTSAQMYYICGVPGHCLQGMKVSVPIYNADGTMDNANVDTGSPPASSAVSMRAGFSWTSQLLLVVVVAAVSAATTAFA